jgi:hypothetical protein
LAETNTISMERGTRAAGRSWRRIAVIFDHYAVDGYFPERNSRAAAPCNV